MKAEKKGQWERMQMHLLMWRTVLWVEFFVNHLKTTIDATIQLTL